MGANERYAELWCGASIHEIARVMHIIECRAHYAAGWMRRYLYEDRDDEWREG